MVGAGSPTRSGTGGGDMAEDWMKWLTGEEAAGLEYTQTVGASAGAAHTVEVLHVCNQAVLNLRTVAALRALVAEKDKALATIAKMPCLTYLLGEDNPNDPCGCACCQENPLLLS